MRGIWAKRVCVLCDGILGRCGRFGAIIGSSGLATSSYREYPKDFFCRTSVRSAWLETDSTGCRRGTSVPHDVPMARASNLYFGTNAISRFSTVSPRAMALTSLVCLIFFTKSLYLKYLSWTLFIDIL